MHLNSFDLVSNSDRSIILLMVLIDVEALNNISWNTAALYRVRPPAKDILIGPDSTTLLDLSCRKAVVFSLGYAYHRWRTNTLKGYGETS
jgi:hypothetical protein